MNDSSSNSNQTVSQQLQLVCSALIRPNRSANKSAAVLVADNNSSRHILSAVQLLLQLRNRPNGCLSVCLAEETPPPLPDYID